MIDFVIICNTKGDSLTWVWAFEVITLCVRDCNNIIALYNGMIVQNYSLFFFILWLGLLSCRWRRLTIISSPDIFRSWWLLSSLSSTSSPVVPTSSGSTRPSTSPAPAPSLAFALTSYQLLPVLFLLFACKLATCYIDLYIPQLFLIYSLKNYITYLN